jgi:hypothetical protein
VRGRAFSDRLFFVATSLNANFNNEIKSRPGHRGGVGDWAQRCVALLSEGYSVVLAKSANYDDTITLEVFSEDRHYLTYSRDRLREMWESIR